jgi:hypothetical protein
MAVAKARGVKLGSPTIAATNRQAADRHVESLRDIVEPIRHLSTLRIAANLNERGVETARGGVAADDGRALARLPPPHGVIEWLFSLAGGKNLQVRIIYF